MEALKPFDILKNKKGAEIIVSLKNDEAYRGILKAFDIHLNIVLDDAVLVVNKNELNIGKVLIRGDNILTVRNL